LKYRIDAVQAVRAVEDIRLIERRAVPLQAAECPQGGHGNLLPVGGGAKERVVFAAVVEEEADHAQVEARLLVPADRGHGSDEPPLTLVLEQKVRNQRPAAEEVRSPHERWELPARFAFVRGGPCRRRLHLAWFRFRV
jgi:hypothetical protein